jgi:hypothetical protein
MDIVECFEAAESHKLPWYLIVPLRPRSKTCLLSPFAIGDAKFSANQSKHLRKVSGLTLQTNLDRLRISISPSLHLYRNIREPFHQVTVP